MSGASIARACSVYCEGDVLHYVQISGVYNDSKTFVDMPMKADPEDINSAFLNLSNPYDTNEIRSFLDAYFYEAGSDLDSWVPTDLLESPSFLEKVSKKYRDWASELNQLWLVLGRQVNESASLYPQRTSFVPRQYPMIVPGGRFRESYYWDSWWIVRGLLVCEMPLTAKYVILNLLDDIKNFGFIPNGGRIYYLDRSQPPLLSEMVVSWLDYVGWSSPNGTEFLRTAYPLLQKEYNWWMNEENHHFLELSDPLSPSTLYPLNVYHSNQTTPRPESYLADLETAEVNIDSGEWETISPSQAELYRNIRTGAETGWDFSSRWFQPILLSSSSSSTFSSSSSSPDEAVYQYNLSSIDTTHIVPVDLNSFMYRFEVNLANFARHIGNDSLADSYQSAASLRREGINQILWNQSTSRSVLAFPTHPPPAPHSAPSLPSVCPLRWNDFNLTSNSQITSYGPSDSSSISSFIPLWAGLLQTDDSTASLQKSVLNSLKATDLIQDAGIATTSIASGQQWDSPNAWPPLVLLIIEGLRVLTISDASKLADSISDNWLETCFTAYSNTGYMFEKYNAFEIGSGGGGGEYTPQIGFGWSNGVALVLLNATPTSTPHDDDEPSLHNKLIGGLGIVGVVFVTIGFLLGLAAIVYVGTKLFIFVTQSAAAKSTGGRQNSSSSLVEVSSPPTNSPFKQRL